MAFSDSSRLSIKTVKLLDYIIVQMLVDLPVGYIYVDDAGLQEFPIQVSARSQDPALVVGQTVSHKQHVVFL